jgi:hypothetical protein
VELLNQVMPLLEACDDVVSRAMLLEKALLVTAHFDQAEAVQAFVDKFEQSLEEIVGHYLQLGNARRHQPHLWADCRARPRNVGQAAGEEAAAPR